MNKNKVVIDSYNNRGLHGLAALSFERLIRLKEDNEQNEFNKTMHQVLPDVKGYIARRLSAAVRNGHLPSAKYKVEDFTNELYLRAFEQIKEVEDEKALHPWLFKKADELLRDTIITEELNESYFDIINHYTNAEWTQMQADFNLDGDGNLMLLEEFDDPSYPNYEYNLTDAFVEESPRNEWLEDLSTELSPAEIHQYIDMVLHQLPADLRSVYDLAVNQRFEPYEIAKIKRISVYQVARYFSQVQGCIRTSIEKRYRKKNGV